MKKILFSILLILLSIPCIVNAEECDTSKVYIDSIGIENSTGEVVELEEATAKDKTVNLNLQMSTKDDEVLYKVVLKNDSSEDYEINKNSININSDYLEYSLESDNNNIVKANSTKTIYLRVKYSKEVDSSKFVDGVYQDDITMKVNLKSDNTISNPKTGIPYLIIISIVLIISGITLIINKNDKISTLLILLGVITLPLGVKALCSCELIIDSKVTIKTIKKYKVEFLACGVDEFREFDYINGMTWTEYFDSLLYNNALSNNSQKFIITTNNFDVINNRYGNIRFISTMQCSDNDYECIEELNNSNDVLINDKIKPMDHGYYIVGDSDC